jgi:hypothetical protein
VAGSAGGSASDARADGDAFAFFQMAIQMPRRAARAAVLLLQRRQSAAGAAGAGGGARELGELEAAAQLLGAAADAAALQPAEGPLRAVGGERLMQRALQPHAQRQRAHHHVAARRAEVHRVLRARAAPTAAPRLHLVQQAAQRKRRGA